MTEQDFFSTLELSDCHAKVMVASSPFRREPFARWRSWLRDGEIQRLAMFRRRVEQELFIARRGLARESIAQMLAVRPGSVHFSVDDLGKLGWASDDLDSLQTRSHYGFDFSISKTPGRVAMAACPSGRVGVDIETIGPLPELEMLAKQNLHPNELQIWHTIPIADRTSAYYHLWVVKEAFAKALGTGLSQSPDSILSIHALEGLPRGSVTATDSDSYLHVGMFWMTTLGEMGRIAVVTL